jgi:antitoxin PrlF
MTVPDPSCCSVQAVVTVDGRGQLVLPKEIRQRAGILAGDKLAVIQWEKGGKVCCLALMKADSLAGSIRQFMGPLLGEKKKRGVKP